MKSPLRIPTSVFALLMLFSMQTNATLIFSDDFEGGADSRWSDGVTDDTVAIFTEFSGRHNNDTLTLDLTGLSTHDSITLNLDAYFIDSWDGGGPGLDNTFGPDTFMISIDGVTIFDESFSNNGFDNQSYTGLPDEFGDLGFISDGFANDAIYRNLAGGFTFSHSASSLNLTFSSMTTGAINTETWGIDNIFITANVPEPSLLLLMMIGLGGIAVTRYHKTMI